MRMLRVFRVFHLLHYSTAECGLRNLSYQMLGWEFHLGSNLFSEAQNYITILIKSLSYETPMFHSRQGPEIFSLVQHVQAGSETHPASYSISSRYSFLGSKAARA